VGEWVGGWVGKKAGKWKSTNLVCAVHIMYTSIVQHYYTHYHTMMYD